MKVTKQQAAEANLDAAVEAFLRGNWVPAIHLAGAAEEVFGRLEEARGGKTVPDYVWEKTGFEDLVTKKKDYIKVLNHFRDWIKHCSLEDSNEIEIQEPHAVLAVMRACIAHARYTMDGRPSVAQFLRWHEKNEVRLDKLVEKWAG